uniref:Innexin n=1 Tax=Macrostomum lignano TaxID=282301 RepID=A0A1I8HQL7_9PLAT
MNFDFFLKVNQFRVSFGQYASAEDFIDVINYMLTPMILIFFAGISASKQYLFTPIQCWSIFETGSSHRMEYIENLCWIENMYYWPLDANLPKDNHQQREDKKMCKAEHTLNAGQPERHQAGSAVAIGQQSVSRESCSKHWPDLRQRRGSCGEPPACLQMPAYQTGVGCPDYYQWVPFVLALQAVCFYLPRICWLFLSDRFGTSIMDIIRFSMSAATVDQDKRQRMVQYLAAHIEKLLYHVQPYRRGRWNQLKTRCAQIFPCFVLTKRTGFVLVGSYLLIKLLYVKNSVLQLVIMQEFLGMNGTMWGLQLLSNMISRRDWERTGIFPRVARCSVKVDYVGKNNEFVMQCVLPNNMLNEKMYLFLWFWTWSIMALTVFSFFSWAISSTMRSSRRTFIKKYLKIMTSIHIEEKALAKKFVNNFLRYDGIFILKMICYNAGDLITAEIVREVWHRFKSKKLELPEADLPLMPPERPPRVTKQRRHNNASASSDARASAAATVARADSAPGDDSASYV